MSFEFAVMLIVKTNDARLTEEALIEALGSNEAAAFAKVRRTVLQHLPRDVERLVAVFPVEHARALMQLHEAFGEKIAAELGEDSIFARPPPDYVPPTRE